MSADEKEPSKSPKWSGTCVQNIAFEEYFPSAVKDLSVQKDIITRFLNYYLGGKVQKGLGVEDLVFAVLSILPVSTYNEQVIWPEVFYKDVGKAFFLTPVEKLASEVKAAIRKSDSVQSPTEVTKAPRENSSADNAEDALNDFKNIDFNTLPELDDTVNDNIDDTDIDHKHNYDYESINESTIDVNDINDLIEKSPDDELYTKPKKIIEDFPKDIQFPTDFASKSFDNKNKILNYGPVENAAFNTCCHELLSHWETDSKSRTVLKSFFAVVAFVLMRATTKSYKHLMSSFHGEKFLRLLHHCFRCGFRSYAPPHKRCLKRAHRTFSRTDGKKASMFAKLLHLVAFSSNKLNKYLKYVIHNGLLNYTADFGFNLIRLLRTVCSKSEDGDITRVMELTLCEATEESWKKIAAFLSEYCARSSNKEFLLCYRWARVLDGRFFKEVSCQQNYALAVILTVFVEKLTGNSGVWQSIWVEDDKLEKYRELGFKFYERYLSQKRESGKN